MRSERDRAHCCVCCTPLQLSSRKTQGSQSDCTHSHEKTSRENQNHFSTQTSTTPSQGTYIGMLFPYYFWPHSHGNSCLDKRFPCLFSRERNSNRVSVILPRLTVCSDHLDFCLSPQKTKRLSKAFAPFITSSCLWHHLGGTG